MVHHNADQRQIPLYASPFCPKCGSLRTEIVGKSQDLKTTFLRCGACGARSELHQRDAAATWRP